MSCNRGRAANQLQAIRRKAHRLRQFLTRHLRPKGVTKCEVGLWHRPLHRQKPRISGSTRSGSSLCCVPPSRSREPPALSHPRSRRASNLSTELPRPGAVKGRRGRTRDREPRAAALLERVDRVLRATADGEDIEMLRDTVDTRQQWNLLAFSAARDSRCRPNVHPGYVRALGSKGAHAELCNDVYSRLGRRSEGWTISLLFLC